MVAGFGRGEAARAQSLAREQAIRYNNTKEETLRYIRSGEMPKDINPGGQNKHLRDSNGYIPGRSYIYGDVEAAQVLVARYAGTGDPKLTRAGAWTHKEFVTADKAIGVLVDQETGQEIETRRFSIHYGKRGTHIVPAKEDVKHDPV